MIDRLIRWLWGATRLSSLAWLDAQHLHEVIAQQVGELSARRAAAAAVVMAATAVTAVMALPTHPMRRHAR